MSVGPTSGDTSQTVMISLPNPTKILYTEHSSDNDMTTTFADYCATADARKRIEENVLLWTQMLCEALEQDYIEESIKRQKFFAANETGNVEVMTKVTEQRIAEIKDRKGTYQFVIETGRKYHKIVMVCPDLNENRPPSRSVHAFVDKKTGEMYMAASWKAPAKNGVRYDLRIIEQREHVLENCDWAGTYLYKR